MKKTILLTLFLTTLFLVAKSQFTKLQDLDIVSGGYPRGELVYDGTYLYGMADVGGAHDSGTIFRIKPDGTGYSAIFDFTSSKGAFPYGSLMFDGTYLYGMAEYGGANNDGVIFKIKPDGTSYTKLFDFDGLVTGGGPRGYLISDGTYLYGMTPLGGVYNYGVFFKIKTDGTGYSKLVDFDYFTYGGYPYGSFFYDGTFLYGTTFWGGVGGFGTVFKIKTDGTGYTDLQAFNNGVTDGGYPYCTLISDGIFLYRTTYMGGTNNTGVIFKIKPDGTGFSKLLDFTGTATGATPHGGLVFDGNFLYGMTLFGGAIDSGVIIKIKPDGTGFSKLFDFSSLITGYTPYGSLISDGNYLYGFTKYGGTNGLGVVFKYELAVAIGISSVPTTLCPAHLLNVPFNVSASFNAGNVFTAQLSNASGSFAAPTAIGSVASTTSGTIAATIPGNTPAGNQYRIRVVSSNPPLIGADNGANITIICGVPASPSVTNITASSAKLNWTASVCAQSYIVQYKKATAVKWKAVKALSNSKTISNLQSSTNYQWRVKTKCVTSPTIFSGYTTIQSFTSMRAGEFLSGGDENVLEVFPNPNTGSFHYHFTDPTITSLKVIDQLGREVMAWSVTDGVNDGTITLPATITPGVYWLIADSPMKQYEAKIVVTP